MGGRLTIRWASAARMGALAVILIAALSLVAGALEPSEPSPLPPDVGLGPIAASPAAPPAAGEDPVGSSRGTGGPSRGRVRERGGVTRHRRPARRLTSQGESRGRMNDPTTRKTETQPEPPPLPPPEPPPAPPEPAPAAEPATHVPAPAPPSPAPPAPAEFGFER